MPMRFRLFVPFKLNTVQETGVPFPLTPALSLRESEKSFTFLRIHIRRTPSSGVNVPSRIASGALQLELISTVSAGPVVGGAFFQRGVGHETGGEGQEESGQRRGKTGNPLEPVQGREAFEAMAQQAGIQLPPESRALDVLTDQ